MLNKRFTFCVILAASCWAGLGQTRVESVGAESKDRRISIQVDKKPLFDVFMRLIYDYDVMIGFEESTLDQDHNDYHFETNVPYDEKILDTPNATKRIRSGGRPIVTGHLITLDFVDAKLADVLNEIVRQMQHYEWTIRDSVVNIYPSRGRDPRFVKLLDLKIRNFNVGKNSEVGHIQPLLILFLPELKKFLDENELKASSSKIAPWFNERPLTEGIQFNDLMFRDLLNNITKSKRGGWILRHGKPVRQTGAEYIELLI